MNCNPKRTQTIESIRKREEEKKQYNDWFNSLSKEEQKQELSRRKRNLNSALKLIGLFGIENYLD